VVFPPGALPEPKVGFFVWRSVIEWAVLSIFHTDSGATIGNHRALCEKWRDIIWASNAVATAEILSSSIDPTIITLTG
jgi:hypothetical protein